MRAMLCLVLFATVAASPSVLAQDLPPGPGSDLTSQTCSACHELSMVSGQRHDKAGWTSVVNTMISNGASVTPQDEDKIVDYLAKAYPASGGQ